MARIDLTAHDVSEAFAEAARAWEKLGDRMRDAHENEEAVVECRNNAEECTRLSHLLISE